MKAGPVTLMMALTLVFLSLPIGADAQTSTDCYRTAVGVTCDASPSSNANFANGVSALANALAVRKQRKAIAEQFGQSLQSGDCERALSIATQYGDANDVAAARRCVSPKVAEQTREQEAEKIWMMGIATAVREGRCDDAKAAALGGGRLDVAEQAMRLCTPPVAAKP